MSSYPELCDCHSYQCASRGSVIFKSLNVLLEGHESKGSVSNEALVLLDGKQIQVALCYSHSQHCIVKITLR